MAITFKGAGTYNGGTGTAVPVLPATAVGDLLLLIVESANQAISITTPAGWTEVGTQASQAVGTTPGSSGNTRLAVFWKLRGASEGNPTVADSGDHTVAIILAFGGVNNNNPINAVASGFQSTASTAITFPNITTTVDNAMVVTCTSTDYDGASTARFSSWVYTGSGLESYSEATDRTINSGSGGGFGAAYGIKTTAGLVSGLKVTESSAMVHGLISIALNPQSTPTVNTVSAINVTQTGATIRGSLANLGGTPDVSTYLEWGLTTAYGHPISRGSLTAVGDFSANITDLEQATTYHFRAYGTTTDAGTAYGNDMTFTTLAFPAPSMYTDTPLDLLYNSVTLIGIINNFNGNPSITAYFEYGTTTSYGSRTADQTIPDGTYAVQQLDVPLQPSTTYHYRVVGTNGINTGYGADVQFTTPAAPVPPTCTTGGTTNLTPSSVTLNGTLSSLGTSTGNVFCSFEWGSTVSYGNTTSSVGRTTIGPFTETISSGLTPGSTYHYRAKVMGSSGTAYGNDSTFTIPLADPVFSTGTAQNITTSSADFHCTVTSLGDHTGLFLAIQYGFTDTYDEGQKANSTEITTPGDYYVTIDNLSPDTTYHFRAYIMGSDSGDWYGSDATMTTSSSTGPTPIPAQFNIGNSIISSTRAQANIDGTIINLMKAQANIDGIIIDIWLSDYTGGATMLTWSKYSVTPTLTEGTTVYNEVYLDLEEVYYVTSVTPLANGNLSIVGAVCNAQDMMDGDYYTDAYFANGEVPQIYRAITVSVSRNVSIDYHIVTTTLNAGTLIETVTAPPGTYPDDGVGEDGYYYRR